MPVLADDDVVMHRYAEWARDIDDGLGHVNIGLRWRRIAGRVVVQEATTLCIPLQHLKIFSKIEYLGAANGDGMSRPSVIITLENVHHRRSFLDHPR